MSLVPAKCPKCGGDLEVDISKEAAICQFCQTPFIVEKAINNYNSVYNKNITINGGQVYINNDTDDERDYNNIIMLLNKKASTFFDSTKDDKLLKKVFDRFYERNVSNCKCYEIQCLDALNSLKRSIENENEDNVDALQFCLEEAVCLLTNLTEIKKINEKLFNELYSEFRNLINDYLSRKMRVEFTGGSIMVKMLYADLFAKFFGKYIYSVFPSTKENSLSFEYYFDNYSRAEKDYDGNYLWQNNSGFLENDEKYDEYCDSVDKYILDDPFDDFDEKYLSFTKTICDIIVKKLFRKKDKHCEYIIRHFDSIQYSDVNGKKEAMKYIYNYLWQDYNDYIDSNDTDFYFKLKTFFIFTKNPFLKKVLEDDFKVSIFGNVSIVRKSPIDVKRMVENSLEYFN